MLSALLHAGHEHPSLWWVVIPSMLSFLAGLTIGSYTDRLQTWLAGRATPE